MSKPLFPVRFWMVVLLSMGFGLTMMLRVNLSVALVSMVRRPAVGDNNLNSSLGGSIAGTNETTSTMASNVTSDTNQPPYIPLHERGTLEWSDKMQGLLLGAYFGGFTPTQLFGGQFAEKYNAVWLSGIGIGVSGLLTMVTPMAATLHLGAATAVRFLIGVFHGPFSLCLFVLISHWLPKIERSTATSAITVGASLGSTIGMPLTAYLCEFGPFGGWHSAFYVTGGITFVWVALWLTFASNYPSQNKYITEYELSYISENKEADNRHSKSTSTPWRAIFTSGGVWASIVAKGTTFFALQVIVSKLPVYLETVLKMPFQQNGLVNGVLSLAICLSTLSAGVAADYLHRKEVFSLTCIRKSFQTVTMMGPAVCFLLIPMVGTDQTWILILFTIAMLSVGFISAGDLPITADMAPHFSGTLFGITNSVGSAMGFIAPFVVGIILDLDNGSRQQWNLVFYLCSFLLMVGTLFFDIFATAEVQKWGLVVENDTELEKTGSLETPKLSLVT